MVIETRPQLVELTDYPAYPPVALKLWEAREWLSDESHWGKYTLISDQGQTCAMGALIKTGAIPYASSTGWIWDNCEPLDMLIKSVKGPDTYAGVIYSVPYFNDAPTTTHADILALFDRAINLALKEGK